MCARHSIPGWDFASEFYNIGLYINEFDGSLFMETFQGLEKWEIIIDGGSEIRRSGRMDKDLDKDGHP